MDSPEQKEISPSQESQSVVESSASEQNSRAKKGLVKGSIGLVTDTFLYATNTHYTFAKGVFAPFRAMKYLLLNPDVLKLAITPWVLNLFVVFPVVIAAMVMFVFPWLQGFFPEPDNWLFTTIRVVTGFIISGILFGLTIAIGYLAAIILGAPFHDKIGERIERIEFKNHKELIAPETPFAEGVRHSLFEAVRRVCIVIPLMVCSFALGLIPIIGAPLVLTINFLITTSFITLDAFSMPMDRRNRTLKEKLGWLKHNFAFAVGFGLPLFVIPCGIFLLPPLAAVAGTMIFCEWQLRNLKETPPDQKGRSA